MEAEVRIENVYPGETHVRTYRVHFDEAYDDDTYPIDEWAEDHIFPMTGMGEDYAESDAAYFAEITACEDMPQLVGMKFEWGL